MQTIPSWLSHQLSNKDLERVEEAIKQVELKTSAELVPMIVRRSSTLGHIPLLLIAIGMALFFTVDGDALMAEYLGAPWWGLGIYLLALLVAVRLLASSRRIARWLTPQSDQRYQVMQRAQLEFYESNIEKTKDTTGILLFISLLERQVVVLADSAVSERHPPKTWGHIVKTIVQSIRKKDLSEGLIEGIHLCGELLEKDFPRESDDVNELPDHLIIKP